MQFGHNRDTLYMYMFIDYCDVFCLHVHVIHVSCIVQDCEYQYAQNLSHTHIKQYFSVPGTSALSERLFSSAAGAAIPSIRNLLKP